MSLTYLTNQVVYLGSHFGDSQLLQIISSPIFGSDSPTLPIPASIRTTKPKDLGKNEDTEGIIVNGAGSYLVVLESFNNLAPIVDGILVDTDDSGQVCIILGLKGSIGYFFYRMRLLLVLGDGIRGH